ncbi:hypothetical protein N0M98_21100 [Paenibacillus doosanensis]|uniref:Uncharacterized protein n=1 Tax=Paenibacillus konkukensis TaxID=2020716 RepID=A0ABY4RJB6_9BACL|nr:MULTISPECIES: hypothetical protein [Paenibacillus]MCS7462623.1 hypothetical protein [Paenibacillus doosanensis]UQZ82557.1 hypothetical protein SK3146_01714 [Paenibacillus konkukensis]
MIKNLLILCGLLLILLVLWIAAGLWFTSVYGQAGFGGTLIIGFVTIPLALRLAVTKLFKAGGKTPDL